MHVGEETVRKRLNEFKTTNTARLTRGKLLELEQEEKDPYKFAIEEKAFEIPKICKQEILKSLMPTSQENQDVDNDLDEVRELLEIQESKFDSKIDKEIKISAPED